MIEVEFSGEREVVAHLDHMTTQVKIELEIGIKNLTVTLQNRVKADKLSGQVLGVRSGRGRRSIEQVVQLEGETIVGIVSTAVPYMIGWETGWSGSSGIKAGTKRFNPKAGDSTTFANGSPKQRAFLVPALRDLEGSGAIKNEINAAVARAVA